jgi:hypothetical protein
MSVFELNPGTSARTGGTSRNTGPGNQNLHSLKSLFDDRLCQSGDRAIFSRGDRTVARKTFLTVSSNSPVE